MHIKHSAFSEELREQISMSLYNGTVILIPP
jgi:hypothetical protein